MKTEYSVNKYIRVIFYAVIAVIFVGFVCAENWYPSERDEGTDRGSLIYEGTLIWEKPDGTREEITAPGDYEVEAGQTMVVTTILPSDYAETAIEIRASQQSVRIYIDGELRNQYDTKNSRPFGSNSASRYVFCRTSEADAGKELRIELLSNSERYSGVVNEIYCGDKADIWAYIVRNNGIEFVIGLFILFTGIITILFSVALGIAYKTKINLSYLGWCFVLGALWLLGESKLRQLLVPNTSVLASLCFVVVMLCPIPLLFYVDSIQQGRYKKLFYIIECVALVNLTVSTILQFAELADYLDTLIVSHVILGTTVLVILATFVLDYRKGKIKDYLLSVIGISIGVTGVLVEMVSAYLVVSVSGIFLGTGLVFLLFFTIIKTVKDVRDMEERRHKEQMEIRRRQTEAMSLQMIQTLSTTIEEKDEYTKGHSLRVAEYAALIAKELGWSDGEAANLKNAAYLHDVGKIGVPDIILNKPTKLLDAEYDIIKTHTTIGADILKNISLIDHVEEVARYHHERYDGSGYPEGLAGEEIPIHARIVAVADSYDAMNSKRIYRNPLSEEVIRKEINRNKGIQFDPVIADVFLKLMDENRIQSVGNMQQVLADELSELETKAPVEAGRFITDVMNTMNSQKETENIDFLTGLPMRNFGENKIAQSMQMHPGCLLFLDMDNLKKINDIYGHKSGDRVLKLLGDTIKNCTENSIACRLGGDEFLIFLPDVARDVAEDVVERIFNSFTVKKDAEIEIRDASLSGGLCMCVKGDTFEDCYAKADKALYYVKQNGKNSYSFYHQLEQSNTILRATGKDLEQIANALRQSGSYMGALDLENREFSKIYEYVSNLGERYRHTCHLVLVTMDAVSDNTMFIEKIEQALGCMETAICENIRNVDVCTRYSSMQYLLILMEAGEGNIPMVMERIFTQYYKLYGENDFRPRYEFRLMLEENDKTPNADTF